MSSHTFLPGVLRWIEISFQAFSGIFKITYPNIVQSLTAEIRPSLISAIFKCNFTNFTRVLTSDWLECYCQM